MRIYGYHRTSTKEQHLDRGIKAINDFCKEQGLTLTKPVVTDQQTGKNFDRPNYQKLKFALGDGDILIVKEFDRLGRNKQACKKELEELKEAGVRVVFLDIPTTVYLLKEPDPLTKQTMEMITNIMIEVLGTMAQQEVERKEQRQREGIEAMKARGDWEKYGRPKAKIPQEFKQTVTAWRNGEMTAVAAFTKLGMKKATFYKKVKEMGL